jgi:hypothetical protein
MNEYRCTVHAMRCKDFRTKLARRIEPIGGPGVEPGTLEDAALFVGRMQALAAGAPHLGLCRRAGLEGGDSVASRRELLAFHEINNPHSQRTGVRSPHRSSPPSQMHQDSLIQRLSGISDSPRRDVLKGTASQISTWSTHCSEAPWAPYIWNSIIRLMGEPIV